MTFSNDVDMNRANPARVAAARDSTHLPALRDLRARWAQIVVAQGLGDQLDGDFATLDEIIHAMEGTRNGNADAT